MAEFQPRLKITAQPSKNLRFRYASETGAHGVLNGRNSTQNFPEIELEVPFSYSGIDFYAAVELCKPLKDVNVDHPELAAELLAEKSKKTISKGPIVEKMIQTKENVYTFSLKDRYIVRPKKQDIPKTLREKYEERDKFITGQSILSQNRMDEIARKIDSQRLEEQQQIKQVCLCFSVYTKDENGNYNLLCKPLLSEPINNDKDIQIVKLCNFIAKFQDDVTLLVSEAKKDEVELCLFEVNECDYEENISPRILWSHTIKGNDLKIHLQAAISFRMPEYTGETQGETIPLYLVIIRPKHGDESPTIKILYKREIYDSMNPFKKRKATSPALEGFNANVWFKDSIGKSAKSMVKNTPLEVKQVQDKINELKKRLHENVENWENVLGENFDNYKGNGFKILCYDAVEWDEFTALYVVIQEFSLQSYVEKMRNAQNESLLHYACKLNKAKVINELIRIGCQVNAMDNRGHVPLYLAISNNSQDCIDVYEDLMKDLRPYEDLGIEKALNDMLAIYDEQGHTILHKAVLKNQLKLVQSILDFCKQQQNKAEQYEVLGEGDTILHLAVSNGLKEMAQLIYKHDPQTIYYRNYAGKAIIEDAEVMLEYELESDHSKQ